MVQLANGDMVENEIESFIDARYIRCTEAYWNLAHFPMKELYPPVKKLALHLEKQQTVLFRDDGDLEEALKNQEKTMLTEFFVLNQQDSEANQYLYPDILRHYAWKPNEKCYEYHCSVIMKSCIQISDKRLPFLIAFHKIRVTL